MSDLDSSQTPATTGARSFPSRREVHGSRIPITADAPAEVAEPEVEASKPGKTAVKPAAASEPPTETGEYPFPSRSSKHEKKRRAKRQKSSGQPKGASQKAAKKAELPVATKSGVPAAASSTPLGQGNTPTAPTTAHDSAKPKATVTTTANGVAPQRPTQPVAQRQVSHVPGDRPSHTQVGAVGQPAAAGGAGTGAPRQPAGRTIPVAPKAARPGTPVRSGAVGGVPPNTVAGTKKRTGRAVFRAFVLLLLLALVFGAVWWAWSSVRGVGSETTVTEEGNDYPGPGTGIATITISSGETGADIGLSLYEADVVKSVSAFTQAFEANSAAATIRPGTYTLKTQMSAAGALAALLDESNRQGNSVTVTPGQSVEQIKERLVGVAGFTEEDVAEALNDPNALGLPSVANGKLEGWLAAGTYEVTLGDSPDVVLTEMVDATKDILTDFDVPEDEWEVTLTKASILEREVITHTDLPKVARVIENRLTLPNAETVGLLQMDSTVLYGVGKYGGIPTASDLADDNPYNTYRNKGLPPSPIATPSIEAIEATLNPADGDWLYFVTVDLDTGETLFAATLAEQVRNQVQLEEWCAANEGRC